MYVLKQYPVFPYNLLTIITNKQHLAHIQGMREVPENIYFCDAPGRRASAVALGARTKCFPVLFYDATYAGHSLIRRHYSARHRLRGLCLAR